MSKKPATMTERILGVIETLSVRVKDGAEFNSYRLAEIENRLSRLDGRGDSAAAKLTAYEAVNTSRRGTGKAPLGFKLR